MSEQRRESSAGRSFSIRVIKFSREECPFSNRDHNWQQFNAFRNAVLDILLSYGTAGPTGKMRILETYEESVHEWQSGDAKPDFFVVDDDMYGLSVRVEASWTLVTHLERLTLPLKVGRRHLFPGHSDDINLRRSCRLRKTSFVQDSIMEYEQAALY